MPVVAKSSFAPSGLLSFLILPRAKGENRALRPGLQSFAAVRLLDSETNYLLGKSNEYPRGSFPETWRVLYFSM